jgi:DNA-binding protein HU-beta
MNKNELIAEIAAKTGLSKADANRALNAVTETNTEALKKGECMPLIGFGTFEVRDRSARIGRNPRTGEELKIKAAKVPAFKGRHSPQGDGECPLRVCLRYFARAAIPCT